MKVLMPLQSIVGVLITLINIFTATSHSASKQANVIRRVYAVSFSLKSFTKKKFICESAGGRNSLTTWA